MVKSTSTSSIFSRNGDVVEITAGKIVRDDNVILEFEKVLDEVAPDELDTIGHKYC